MEVVFVRLSDLTSGQRQRIKELQKECFSHVSREEVEECFIAEGFGWIFAYENATIAGQVELHSRTVLFEGKQVSLGGLGGACVTAASRNRGIAKAIVKKGLEILRHEKKSDVACLNADIRHHPDGGLYHQLGFRLMKRRISFEDVYGKTRYDIGELFIPLCSQETYDYIMESDRTFHLGRGYW
ncbi:MAG TPA: GNAT family N-acetyltransferase [Candidatus Bathyarchaeia archaeon]